MADIKDLQPGPFTNNRTTTFKISAFELSVTTKEDSSHVPPRPCGCGGGDAQNPIAAIVAFLRQHAEAQAARAADGTDAPESTET